MLAGQSEKDRARVRRTSIRAIEDLEPQSLHLRRGWLPRSLCSRCDQTARAGLKIANVAGCWPLAGCLRSRGLRCLGPRRPELLRQQHRRWQQRRKVCLHRVCEGRIGPAAQLGPHHSPTLVWSPRFRVVPPQRMSHPSPPPLTNRSRSLVFWCAMGRSRRGSTATSTTHWFHSPRLTTLSTAPSPLRTWLRLVSRNRAASAEPAVCFWDGQGSHRSLLSNGTEEMRAVGPPVANRQAVLAELRHHLHRGDWNIPPEEDPAVQVDCRHRACGPVGVGLQHRPAACH